MKKTYAMARKEVKELLKKVGTTDNILIATLRRLWTKRVAALPRF